MSSGELERSAAAAAAAAAVAAAAAAAAAAETATAETAEDDSKRTQIVLSSSLPSSLASSRRRTWAEERGRDAPGAEPGAGSSPGPARIGCAASSPALAKKVKSDGIFNLFNDSFRVFLMSRLTTGGRTRANFGHEVSCPTE